MAATRLFCLSHNIIISNRMQDIQGGQLKVIDLNQKQFDANGKTYYIETSLSFERYIMYQKMQHQLAWDAGFYGVYETLKKTYELVNQMKFADAAVQLHNTMSGLKMVDSREVPALTLCALFINTEEEDRKIINDDMIKKKLADWEAEGLDILPFFQLAMDSIQNFKKVYSEIILSSSED